MLLEEELLFQGTISTEIDTQPSQVPFPTQDTPIEPVHPLEPDFKSGNEPESELNEDAVNLLNTLLADAGFSYDDENGDNKRTIFNRATDLIFKEYEELIGHPLQHKGLQDIEKALLPFFERRSGDPKSIGFTAGTIKNYVSKNKTDREEKSKTKL